MSARKWDHVRGRAVWEFTEAEFRELLGISDPEGVLSVRVKNQTNTVAVTLLPSGLERAGAGDG